MFYVDMFIVDRLICGYVDMFKCLKCLKGNWLLTNVDMFTKNLQLKT